MTLPSPSAPPAPPGELLGLARAVAAELPRRLGLALALALAESALEGASVLLLVELLAQVGVGGVPGAQAVGAPGPGLAGLGVAPTLGGVLSLFVLAVALRAGAGRWRTVVAAGLEQEMGGRVRRRLYRALAQARWPAVTRLRSAELLHALTTEADRVASSAAHLVALVGQALASSVYLGLALRTSAPVTGVALACGGLVVALQGRFRARARAAGRSESAAMAAVVGTASEHVGGLKVVKSYGAEERSAEAFAAATARAAHARVEAVAARQDALALLSVGSVVALAAVTWLAVRWLALPGATVLLLVFLFSRLVPRLGNLQMLYQMLGSQLPAWSAVHGWTQRLEAERERASVAPAEVHALREGVRLEGVRFAYGPGLPPVLRGLELWIPACSTVALVGGSGAGKSTVADVVMGLAAPEAGQVVVDGRPLAEAWVRGWRAGIGYVAQDTLLFHDTVLQNVRWARPEATEAEVWEALEQAAARDFVAALPQGLHTPVGDRGVRLSGGERQRLALARALLRRPALLILDEATSALDAENERRVLEAVRALHGRVTVLMITHRLASVRDADAVHVLEGGVCVESGSWEELAGRPGGRFRELLGEG